MATGSWSTPRLLGPLHTGENHHPGMFHTGTVRPKRLDPSFNTVQYILNLEWVKLVTHQYLI